MEKLLGFPVVETVGHRGHGIAELKAAIVTAASRPAQPASRLVLGEVMDRALAAIRPLLPKEGPAIFRTDWMATRLLVGDRDYTAARGRDGGRARSPSPRPAVSASASKPWHGSTSRSS